MKYIKPKHPAITWALVPWFVETEENDKVQIFSKLYAMLSTEPDRVFIQIAMEGEMARAVLIAHEEEDHVWIWQARAKKGFGESDKMFSDLCTWAKSRGKDILRLSTQSPRFEKLYERWYGFEKKTEFMEKAI